MKHFRRIKPKLTKIKAQLKVLYQYEALKILDSLN